MARYLKQNTATRVTVGPFIDKTDGFTPEVALTATNEHITFVVDDGGVPTLVIDTTATASGGDNDLVHITNDNAGYYDLELTAAQTNYLGRAVLSVNYLTDHLPVFHEFQIVPANVYDSMFSTDKLEVDLAQIGGSAVSTTSAQLGVNVVQVSGDATAADNLELFMDGTGYAGGTTPLQVVLTTNGVNAVADQVWDEAASGHVAAGSFGARLAIIRSATAQAGAGTSITLDASASAIDDFYNNQALFIVSGTGVGQGRIVEDYVGSTKVASVAAWGTNPDATSVFVIVPFGSIPGATAPSAADVADAVWDEAASGHTTAGTFGQYIGGEVTRAATAQAGTTSSITLDSGASATTNLYRYHRVEILGGTGAGQASYITAYNGTTKVATVDPAFAVAPSSDSVFIVRKMGLDAATPAQVADAVWDEARSGHVSAGTFGEYVLADAVRISSDATAADNLEAAYDGAGYAGGTIKQQVALADTTHGGSAATLTMKRVVVANTTNDQTAVDISSSGTGNAHALAITASGAGKGVAIGAASVGVSINSSAADGMTIAGGTDSDGLQIDGNGTGVDVRADITGSITGNVSGSVGSVTGAVGSVTAGVTLTNAGIDALYTRQLTESYATDGAAPTVAQALMLIQQMLGDFSISGTTLTVKKVDGTTDAATFTLNDGSAPTAITRAS
jgi:hypothetical protein